LSDAVTHGALRWGSDDAYAAPWTHLNQALLAQGAQSAQNCVAVDAHHSSEMPGWRQALANLRLTVGYRTTDLCRNLLMEQRSVIAVDVDG
jgi:hypothetical protein